MILTKIVDGIETPCSPEEIEDFIQRENEHKARINSYKKEKYKEDRKLQYLSLADQLDMIWHAMDEGEIPKAKDWFNAIKSVKDANPKGKGK